jgi:hypothetical protein
MRLADLLVLYGAAGVASASVIYKSAPQRAWRALPSALLALPLWPLWLPIVLSARRRPNSAPGASHAGHGADATRQAIWQAHEAVVGGPLEPLLPREAALRMLQEVERAAQRHRELAQLLEQPGFSVGAAQNRIEELTRAGASPRGLAPARLQLENARRLQELCRRDEQTLLELGELVAALRSQLVLARFNGGAPADAGDIVSEVWARVEVLGSALDTPLASGFDIGHAQDQAHPAG